MQQVVTPRRGQAVVGGRGRVGGITQRPVRRDRPAASAQATKVPSLRALITYLPWLGRVVLVVIVFLLLFAGYRAAASANFFQVKNVDVTGTVRVSPDEIRAMIRRETLHTGVWNADVATIRTEIEQVPWVRYAAVSRVLPDGLRVRITERVPYAIVHTDANKFVWVDQDAVVLGPMSLQHDQLPPFFLRGWDTGWGAPAENRSRLELYQEILTKWQSLGLTAKVSELDLTNPKLIQVSLSGEYANITVKIYAADYGEGLQRALEKLSVAPNVAEVNTVTIQPNRTILDVAPHSIKTGDPADETAGEVEPGSPNSGGPMAHPGEVPPVPRVAPPDAAAKKKAAATEVDTKETRSTKRLAAKPSGDARLAKPGPAKDKAVKKPEASKPKGETRPRRVN